MAEGCARPFPLATAAREANIGAVGMPSGFRRKLRSKEGAMTTRVFTSPLFLGFDHLEQILERASKAQSDGYPPYNIEQTGPSGLRISLAVARRMGSPPRASPAFPRRLERAKPKRLARKRGVTTMANQNRSSEPVGSIGAIA